MIYRFCTVIFMTFLNSQSEQRLNLPTNGHIYVTNDIEFRDKCTVDRIYMNSDHVLRLKENDLIFLDYGKIELVVEKVGKSCAVLDMTWCPFAVLIHVFFSSFHVVFQDVLCLIKRGELLGSRRVVHIPGVPVDTAAFTKQYERNIKVGSQLKVDIILVPRVQDATSFNTIKNLVGKCL